MKTKSLLIVLLLIVLIPALLIHKLKQKIPSEKRPRHQQASQVTAPKSLSSHKTTFINKILPSIRLANQQIMDKRQQLLTYYAQWEITKDPKPTQKQWLKQLANDYRLENANFSKQATWETLMKRVDIIPTSLVLAQAITETGWGSSRFANENNNYFGTRCTIPGCGVVPKRRVPGAIYEVRTYPTILASVKDYMRNYNTNPVYQQLRNTRAKLRQEKRPVTGLALVGSLSRYSELGEAYVTRISAVISEIQPKLALVGREQEQGPDPRRTRH